jgi:TM2 domain-containing membrane protein YozV
MRVPRACPTGPAVQPQQKPKLAEPAAEPEILPEDRTCPFCDEVIRPNARKCKHCGEILDPTLRTHERETDAAPGVSEKRILPAFLLCFFLGGLGLHRFYAGLTGSGIAMLVLCLVGVFTCYLFIGIPMLIAVWVWAIVDLIVIVCGGLVDSDGNRISQW